MFRKVFLLLFLAGIVSMNPVDYRLRRLKKTSPLNVSLFNIPAKAKLSRSHLTVPPPPCTTCTTKKSDIETEEISDPESTPTVIIKPAIVKTVTEPTAVPKEKKVTVEAYEEVTAVPLTATSEFSDSVPITVQPLQEQTETVTDEPTVPYISDAVGYSQAVFSTVPDASQILPETATAYPSPTLVTAVPVQTILPLQVVDRLAPIQYINTVHPGQLSIVPVTAKQATEKAQQIVTTSRPVQTSNVAHLPPSQYIKTVLPGPIYAEYTDSFALNQGAIEAQKAITEKTPIIYVTPTSGPKHPHSKIVVKRPPFQSVPESVVQTVHPSVAVLPQPLLTPTLRSHPVHHYQGIINPAAIQYLSHVKLVNVEPAQANPPVAAIATTVAPVHHVQPVQNPADVQYVYTPVSHNVGVHKTLPVPRYGSSVVHYSKPVHVKPTVDADTVTIEAQQSVIADQPVVPVAPTAAPVHPVDPAVNPEAIDYLVTPLSHNVGLHDTLPHHGPTLVHYSTYPVFKKPVTVPVIYNGEGSGLEYVNIPRRHQPTRLLYTHESPVPQPIPVPVLYPTNDAHIRLNQKVVAPVAYTKSKLVQKDHASANLIDHARRSQAAYSSSLRYSPASVVSRVSFNGLGVSYAW